MQLQRGQSLSGSKEIISAPPFQKSVVYLIKSKNETVRQYTARLLNTFASLSEGKYD